MTMSHGQGALGPDEADRLRPYVTNLDRRVFGLRNLPEVVKGALFSRYSRSPRDLRRILLDEFLDLHLQAGELWQDSAGDRDVDVARARADDFYDRVLVGYGDDSVAELAGAHIAVEQVSNLAAKALEDSRIGISPLEKSTRYVRFDQPGQFGHAYHRGGELLSSPVAQTYLDVCDMLFETYADLLPKVVAWVRRCHPPQPAVGERAYNSATRAKAFDLVRGLLPASTLTNVGLYGNGRAFEYLLNKLAADELPECRGLATEMHGELVQLIPSFVHRALDQRYGQPQVEHLRHLRASARAAARSVDLTFAAPAPTVRLVDYDLQAVVKVVSALLYPELGADLATVRESVANLESRRRAEIVAMAMAGRGNRRHKPPRAFEAIYYTFEIVANFGAYRDLQRHRMLTQHRQLLGSDLGYDMPNALADAGLSDPFEGAMERAAEGHRALASELGPVLAQYVVPLAFRMRWSVQMNLREVYHMCELRSARQGHADYRLVAQQIYREVHSVHPELIGHASFVDLSSSAELERIEAEAKLDARLTQLPSGQIVPADC